MCHIYLIVCLITNMQYVGQTYYENANDRKDQHWYIGRKMIEYRATPKEERLSNYVKNSRLYNAMATYGLYAFTFQLIETCEYEELNEREIYHIKRLGTLSPGGYNLTTGGDSFRHSQETKELMGRLARKRAPFIIDKWRSPDTKGLRMYITRYERGTKRGFAIVKHPLCKYKAFLMGGKSPYKTLDECKFAAIEFLVYLEATGEPHPTFEKSTDLPIGIIKRPTGYVVTKKINGKSFFRGFLSQNESDESKLSKAREYLQNVLNSNRNMDESKPIADLNNVVFTDQDLLLLVSGLDSEIKL